MFKLKEIQLYNHPMFEDKISFVDDGEEFEKNYITLIIGANGTGKSQILKVIADIFVALNEYKAERVKSFRFEYEFDLLYVSYRNLVRLEYRTRDLKAYSSGKYIPRYEIPLPSNILVLPYNFNDRFTVIDKIHSESKQKSPDSFYKYLGLKSASNNIFLSSPAKKVLDGFSSIIEGEKQLKHLVPLFKLLSFSPRINVYHKTGRNFNFLMKKDYLINEAYDIEDFVQEFESFIKKKSKTIRRRFNEKKLIDTLSDKKKIAKTIRFLKKNPSMMMKETKSSKIIRDLTLNLKDEKSIAQFRSEVIPYEVLRDLEIFSFDRMEIEKAKSRISMEKISSGEYHLLFSIVNLFANITDNSLLLIDEPEISLHPNWQVEYLDILQKVFRPHKGIHFVISSHSHFVVSSLKKKDSSILYLSKDLNNKTVVESINLETYGWDPERILYKIFGMVTTRNKYFELHIRTLIDLISRKSDDFEKIKKLTVELGKYILKDEDDPLRLVIEQSNKYLFSNNAS